jgi:two-component system, response regulator PdtaR
MHVVLVAEDEPLILMAAVDHLTEEGFEVLAAGHAEEALAILALKAADVHVLFTDVHMPGELDGVALTHRVSTHWPWIGLLVTSAYLAQSKGLPAGCRFLHKPYSRGDVVLHIRELIKAAS